MCTGTQTRMTCGHILIHYERRCNKPCKTLTGPVNYLNDTCAACHPSHVMSEISMRHDSLRASLMRKLRTATSREEVTELQRALEEEQAGRNREMRAASRIKWNGIVDWGNGEGRQECEN
jgi:hypothetical protein